ncbi:MAG: hypothetical protein GQ468_05355 [Candidatus Scalindua sp.]|nr:hypothetical protein [Candidatus Scalindua sp.]
MPEFGVFELNWRTVGLFLSFQTQWRETPLGVGLDYASVNSCIDRFERQTADRLDLFVHIQIMEFSAAKVLNKK